MIISGVKNKYMLSKNVQDQLRIIVKLSGLYTKMNMLLFENKIIILII